MSSLWKVGSAGVILAMILAAGLRMTPVAAQQQQQPTHQPGAMPDISQPSSTPHMPGVPAAETAPDPMRASMREQMIHQANEQRHKKMLDDANKLVQLSNELKVDVEKTQKDELSLEVLKKAAELEKLAHDVQQKMKQ